MAAILQSYVPVGQGPMNAARNVFEISITAVCMAEQAIWS